MNKKDIAISEVARKHLVSNQFSPDLICWDLIHLVSRSSGLSDVFQTVNKVLNNYRFRKSMSDKQREKVRDRYSKLSARQCVKLLLFKSTCPQKSNIEWQTSKFRNRSNFGYICE